jgi:hypothetical protein
LAKGTINFTRRRENVQVNMDRRETPPFWGKTLEIDKEIERKW